MYIITDARQEVWHGLQEPGAYEWWYFDAEDVENDLSLVVIWFAGFPFSPYYMQSYDHWKRHRASPGPLPENYAGFSFQLYEKKRETLNFIREGGSGLFESSSGDIGVRFENNRFVYNPLRDDYRLSIDFVFPSRNRRVRAELTFRVIRRASYEKQDTNGLGLQARHQWLLSVPRAEVCGYVDIAAEDGGGRRRIVLNAHGYHDHNMGTMAMQEYIDRWYWGRALSDRYDMVYYMIFFRNTEYKPVTFLMLHDNLAGTFLFMDTLQFKERDFSAGFFVPFHGRRLELSGEGASATILQKQILDAGPFYLRFASSVSIRIDGEQPIGISGIAEFLNPVRLCSRFMRFFIRSRISRDGQSSFMYDWYNFFKRSADWFRP